MVRLQLPCKRAEPPCRTVSFGTGPHAGRSGDRSFHKLPQAGGAIAPTTFWRCLPVPRDGCPPSTSLAITRSLRKSCSSNTCPVDRPKRITGHRFTSAPLSPSHCKVRRDLSACFAQVFLSQEGGQAHPEFVRLSPGFASTVGRQETTWLSPGRYHCGGRRYIVGVGASGSREGSVLPGRSQAGVAHGAGSFRAGSRVATFALGWNMTNSSPVCQKTFGKPPSC